MSDDLQSRALAILMNTIEMPQSEREAFVQAACGGEPDLLGEVHSLLQSHAQAGEFLANPTMGAPPSTLSMPACPILEGPGSRIGRYKLLQLIGEGGFGSVFMAEQEHPVRRRVALKIIKLGMDTKAVIARFEAERQALAMMDHPNIASVLDAGATDTGRPFFVMELVKGVPITEFCGDQKLSTRERLELFVQICHAIQHAHQKGVIHRDIKPGNVLVTMHDDKAVPKVIDFGISKATASQLTEKTFFTEFRQFIGTPAYMSPEQAQMSGLDVDTRSDVYALGVLLYELLTGTTPFDPKELRAAAYEELRRIIREVEPPRPSVRLSSLCTTLPGLAVRGRADPAQLARSMRGELDWIVMKALEKDRTRRYETASGLAMDVRRYLSDETVEACPPSARYRLGKLARKYRGPLRATVAGVLLLLVTAAFSAWQAVRATRAEGRARADRDRLVAEKARADGAAIAAKAADDFLLVNRFVTSNMLPQQDTSTDQGAHMGTLGHASLAPNPNKTIREGIDDAVETLAGNYKDRPRVEIGIRKMIGENYCNVAAYDKAEAQLQIALSLARKTVGDHDPDFLDCLFTLAVIKQTQGRYKEAETLFLQAMDGARQLPLSGKPLMVTFMAGLGQMYLDEGRLVDTERLFQQVLEDRRSALGPTARETLMAMDYLANAYQEQGRMTDAELLRKQAVKAARETLPRADRLTLHLITSLAIGYRRQNRFREAEPLLDEVLEESRKTYGESHSQTCEAMDHLADLYAAEGRFKDAEALHQRTLQALRETRGEGYPETVATMGRIGIDFFFEDRLADAQAQFEQALKAARQSLGELHPLTSSIQVLLGGVLRAEHRSADAVRLYEQMMQGLRSTRRGTDVDTLKYMSQLALTYQECGRPADAQRLYLQALETQRKLLGDSNQGTLRTMSNLASCYKQEGRIADAKQLAEQTLELQRKVLGESHPDTLDTMNVLGGLYTNEGRYREAEQLLEAVLRDRRSVPDSPLRENTLWTMTCLVITYEKDGRYADAERLGEQTLQGDCKVFGETHGVTVSLMMSLISLSKHRGDYPRAAAIDLQLLAAALGHPDEAGSPEQNAMEEFSKISHGWGNQQEVNRFQARELDLLAATAATQTRELASNQLTPDARAKRFVRRATLSERQGKLADAASDYQRAIELNPIDHESWYHRGCLLAYLKDEDAYRSYCKAMLEKFGGSDDKFILDRTAKTCLLLPGAGDPKRLLGMAERIWAQVGKDQDLQAWFALCRSLALYRSGDFPGSAEWAAKCGTSVAESDAPPRTATADLLLAMADERLGHHAEAMAAWTRAEAIIEKLPQAGQSDLGEVTSGVENWLICQVLLREAKSTISDVGRRARLTSRPSD